MRSLRKYESEGEALEAADEFKRQQARLFTEDRWARRACRPTSRVVLEEYNISRDILLDHMRRASAEELKQIKDRIGEVLTGLAVSGRNGTNG